MQPPTFKCACGADTLVEPDEGPAVCEECCGKGEDGHEFEYDRAERGHRCKHCFAEPPPDFYDRWG